MGTYKEVEGNLITLALQEEFDVIAHGCNCFCVMGAGLAPQMAKAFGADKFEKEHKQYVGDINKLGTIDYQEFEIVDGKIVEWSYTRLQHILTVVNCYSQYGFGINHEEGSVAPLDYEALTLCMRKIGEIFKGKKIGLPLIGCHLAGGIWDANDISLQEKTSFYYKYRKDVKTIIQDELSECDVTIVKFKP